MASLSIRNPVKLKPVNRDRDSHGGKDGREAYGPRLRDKEIDTRKLNDAVALSGRKQGGPTNSDHDPDRGRSDGKGYDRKGYDCERFERGHYDRGTFDRDSYNRGGCSRPDLEEYDWEKDPGVETQNAENLDARVPVAKATAAGVRIAKI